jgi:hypothetical protein
MKTHHRFYAAAVLLLVTGTVHAQLTETMPGVYVDMDTVRISLAQKWVVDSICVAMEVKEHGQLLVKYEKMPDLYFDNLSKRLNHQYSRGELISYEKDMIAVANKKFPIYRKAYEISLAAK